MSTELEIRDGQTTFDQKQLAALEQLGVERASRADQAIFFHQCVRTGLDPFARQIYMVEREGKQTIQTGIDGYRLVARRAADRTGGTLGYEDPQWCGKDGEWREAWLAEEPPAAARVVVLRDGQRFAAVAHWREYVGKKRNGEIVRMWQRMPAGQLAKCAEALALRKAFPQDLSGIYTSDEIDAEADTVDGPPTAAKPAGTTRVSRARKVTAEQPKPEPPDLEGEAAPSQEEELPLGVDTDTGEVQPTEDDYAAMNAEAAADPQNQGDK